MTPLLSELPIGEGATILLLPAEDSDLVAAELVAFWDELERRPGMDDEPSDEEIAAWLDTEAEGDPNYHRWLAEGAPAMQWTLLDSANILPVEDRDDYVGV